MLMYGNAIAADYVFDRPNTKIYNLTSLAERYAPYRIPIVPPNSLGSINEYEFDINYMHWIIDNDINFSTFMTMIIDLYNGIDIFIVVSEDDWSQMITESLLKLIQQRYGIIGACINNIDDLLSAEDIGFAEGYGIYNLDNDIERYNYIYQDYKVKNGLVRSDDYVV